MDNNQLTRRFLSHRFGMFIHWGVYSMLAGEWKGKTVQGDLGEWIMNVLQIPVKEYEKIAAGFNPVNFDAGKLVKLAKRAGMRYIVITSKHHDGFAMFHSECDPYNIYDWTACKRDVIQELAAACRKYGLKLGFYYSQALDWHEKHAGGWDVEPSSTRISWANVWDYPDNKEKDFSIYFENKVKPQVTELLTRYGDVFLMWFDTPRTITREQSDELYRLVKSLQPDCLVNSRIGNGKGDYGSLGDNQIPTVPLGKPNEAPVTLNDTWGYKHYDHNWKTREEIIEILMKLASRNVNLLLNIGPRGDGSLTEETEEILEGISDWTERNSEAIYDTSGNPVSSAFDWGYMTVGQDKVYLCFKEDRERTVELNGLLSRVKRVHPLEVSGEVAYERVVNEKHNIHTLRLDIPQTGFCFPVFAIECDGTPKFDDSILQQNDALILSPLAARLYDGRIKHGESVIMDNRYTDYEDLGKVKIDRGGVLTGWSKQDEYIEWEAKFTKPGEYRVEIITSKREIREETRRECEVEVRVSHSIRLNTNLKKDFEYSESRTSTYNARVGTYCGTIDLKEEGPYSIRIQLVLDLREDNEEIPLVALRFIRQP